MRLKWMVVLVFTKGESRLPGSRLRYATHAFVEPSEPKRGGEWRSRWGGRQPVSLWSVRGAHRHAEMLRPYPHSMMRSTLPPPPLVDAGAGQHSHGNGAASWGERIRPERTPPRRNNVQKMQWRSSRWVDGFLHVSDQVK